MGTITFGGDRMSLPDEREEDCEDETDNETEDE